MKVAVIAVAAAIGICAVGGVQAVIAVGFLTALALGLGAGAAGAHDKRARRRARTGQARCR